MKERPILFSAPMVRALLDGSKTQTRRPYKVRYHPDTGCEMAASELVREPQHVIDRCCPYGRPGEQLWVRETHRPIFGQTCGLIAVDYKADPQEKWERMRDHAGKPKWTPSIHMKREYSRILLEIVAVRVERLNECSAADAVAEGIRRVGPGFERWHPDPADVAHTGSTQDAVLAYRGLWESINGAGAWAANPWVWVIEFKRVTP